jgi:hypothetical protein
MLSGDGRTKKALQIYNFYNTKQIILNFTCFSQNLTIFASLKAEYRL